MTHRFSAFHIVARISACVLLAMGTSLIAGASEVQESRATGVISWKTGFGWDHAVLSVSGPAGFKRWTIAPGSPLALGVEALAAWAEAAAAPVDGAYTYELHFAPQLNDDVRAELVRRRAEADGAGPLANPVATLPRVGGTFRIADGVIAGTGSPTPERAAATKDVLHYDDVITTGSLCVGFDCINGETFGYCTTKLK